MKKPTITQSDMHEFVDELRKGNPIEVRVVYVGDDNSVAQELLDDFVSSVVLLKESCSKGIAKSKDKKYSDFEREASPMVANLLRQLPLSCKFDPGFWSYLSYRIADVIIWRYPPNDSDGWAKNFVASHTVSDFIDGFLPRIAVKGLVAEGSTGSTALTQQDFWRSHILRVKTGFSKNVSQAFAEAVISDEIVVEKQRSMAKLIRSIRSNVIFETLSASQAKDVVDSVK